MTSESFEMAALEEEFQKALSSWHATHAYLLDYRVLAERERAEVVFDAAELDRYARDEQRIYINPEKGVRRERHIGMHELSHHLLYELEGGAFFARAGKLAHERARSLKGLMEQLCDRGGRELAIPRPLLTEVFLRCPDDAERAMRLAIRCKVSLALAGQRIADLERNRAVWGVVLGKSGFVEDHFGNGVKKAKYKVGRGFKLPDDHPLRQPFAHMQLEFFKAAIPFKRSRTRMPRYMQAMADELRGQTIVFFNSRRAVGRAMTPLFGA